MFQTTGYSKCKGPEVEAYLICSRNSKEASVDETEEARVGEDRKRDRENSCTMAYSAQKTLIFTLSRSGSYWRIQCRGATQSDLCLKNHSGWYLENKW